MSYYPYGSLYPPFGYAKRNEPVYAPPVNPLPENATVQGCGDAGKDGYTVLSRASRMSGERPTAGGPEPVYEGPRMSEDY